MKKLISGLVAGLVVVCSGEVLTWTGGANDGLMGSANNWSPAAVPQSGDSIFFNSSADIVVSNNLENLSLANIETTFGTATTTINGNAITLTGNDTKIASTGYMTAITNASPLVINVPVTISGTKVGVVFGKNLTFNKDVVIDGTSSFCIYRDWSGRADEYNKVSMACTFNGKITAAEGMLYLYTVDGHSVWFNDVVNVKKLESGAAYTGNYHFGAAGNYWTNGWIKQNGRYWFEAEGAWPEERLYQCPSPSDAYYRNLVYINANTRMKGIISDEISLAKRDTNVGNTFCGQNNATLTLINGHDYEAYCTLCSAASDATSLVYMNLVYAPNGDWTQTFHNRKHAIAGTITVNGGTLKFDQRVEFTNLEKITINGGTLELAATNVTTVLPAAKEIKIGASGTLKTSAANPFGTETVLYITEGSKVYVAEGTTATVKGVMKNGVGLKADTYTSEDWLTGGGSVVVTTDEPYWKEPKDGSFITSSMWTTWLSPERNAYITADSDEPYTVKIMGVSASTMVVPKETFVSGKAILQLDGIPKMAPMRITLSEGGTLLVNNGCKIDPGTGDYTDDNRITINSGSKMKVQSGILKFVSNTKRGAPIKMMNGGELELYNGTLDIISNSVASLCGTITLNGTSALNVRSTDGSFWMTPANDTPRTVTYNINDSAGVYFQPGDGGTWMTWMFGSENNERVIFNYNSTVRFELPSSCNIVMGHKNSHGELNISDGYVQVAGHSQRIGGTGNDVPVLNPSGEGILRVTGNGVFVNASTTQYGRQINGIILGRGYGATVASPGWCKGWMYVADEGIVTNAGSAYLLAGCGFASGHIHQAGGTIYNANVNYQTVLGAWGGDGEWVITNGISHVKSDVYVGGIFTNELHGTVHDWGLLNERCNWDCHTARGLLACYGGSFTCEKKILVGHDGVGTVELAGAGVINTKDINFETTYAPAACNFTLNDAGAGALVATGTITVDDGATLTVNVGDYNGRRASFPLVRGTIEGEFTTNIIGEKAHLAKLVQTSTGITLTLARGSIITIR